MNKDDAPGILELPRLQDIIIKNAEISLALKFGAESELVRYEWTECLGLMAMALLSLPDENALDYFSNSVFTRFFTAFAPDLLPYILEKSVEEYAIAKENVNVQKEKDKTKDETKDEPG